MIKNNCPTVPAISQIVEKFKSKSTLGDKKHHSDQVLEIQTTLLL